MCGTMRSGGCGACARRLTRRAFVGCCSGMLAGGGALMRATARAAEPPRRKVRVAVVFVARPGVSWPSPKFETKPREEEILRALRRGCPEVEFLPVEVRESGDIQKAATLKEQVDGYLVYCLTLCWPLTGTIQAIGKLGKPMAVADELLGGSGVFLVGYSRLRRQGIPAAGVSSDRLDDLVAAARCFAELRPETTPEAFAQRCETVYRRTFGTQVGPVQEDQPQVAPISQCLARFRKYRFLIVGRGREGQEADFLGAEGRFVGFDEFNAAYEQVDPDLAAEEARKWIDQAEKVVEPPRESILKGSAVYLATRRLLERYETDTVTMNCLGGFAAGKLPAYPCLGFMQLLNDGGQGVCEAMPDDTLSMLMARLLTGRPGFVSDPVLDTSKNRIIYAHCVATTRAFGPEGPANRFRIRTLHNLDPRGACAQSFLPEGYLTTSFRTNFARREMVIHQARSCGNLDADRGCRTQLVAEVCGDIGKLFYQWDRFGWHRVTVYGDLKEPLVEFGKALGLKIIEEA